MKIKKKHKFLSMIFFYIFALFLGLNNTPQVDCIEQLQNMQVSCSIGNGCDEQFRIIEHQGDVQVNDQRLQILNLELRIIEGNLLWGDLIVDPEDVQNGLYENITYLCTNSKIVIVQ